MAGYVVDEEFLKGIGFTDFESIKHRQLGSWWDLESIIEKVKEEIEEENIELSEEKIEEIALETLDSLAYFDYSDINVYISDVIEEKIKEI